MVANVILPYRYGVMYTNNVGDSALFPMVLPAMLMCRGVAIS